METEPTHSTLSERPPRILVAEDDIEMRRLVIESLKHDGYEVVDITDGGQLLVHLTVGLWTQTTPIDLVITDVRMPVCSGLDIVRSLREAEWTTPILIMTAFGDAETRAQAKSLGAVLLDKPFKMRALRAIVRGLLAPKPDRA